MTYWSSTHNELLNENAFAGIKTDGSVVTWGNASSGGDSSAVTADLSVGVVQIYSNPNSFAALKEDGSVVTWGHSEYGGDSSSVDLSSGVIGLYAAKGSFAALKDDGSVVTWGAAMGIISTMSHSLTGCLQLILDIDARSAPAEEEVKR